MWSAETQLLVLLHQRQKASLQALHPICVEHRQLSSFGFYEEEPVLELLSFWESIRRISRHTFLHLHQFSIHVALCPAEAS